MARLFVICGHGAGDPGACAHGFEEAERVRALGKRIKELGGDKVLLGDVRRNFYSDQGICKLKIPKDYQIVELHMDSAAQSARGAHVIINSIFEPDKHDNALADYFCGLFPGRSVKISRRADLANPRRAAVAGYGYRLIECGFISNKEDLDIFNKNINNMAKNILRCFDISVSESKPVAPSRPLPKPNRTTGAVFTCTGLWSQANGGRWYPASNLIYGKGDYTIGNIHKGAEHPYEAIKNGAIVGFANDKCIDDEPTLPGSSPSKPVTPTMTSRQFAKEVWYEGKHGTGDARKASAKRYGVDYNEVQRFINALASGGKI